jgi:hypothetical protein
MVLDSLVTHMALEHYSLRWALTLSSGIWAREIVTPYKVKFHIDFYYVRLGFLSDFKEP